MIWKWNIFRKKIYTVERPRNRKQHEKKLLNELKMSTKIFTWVVVDIYICFNQKVSGKKIARAIDVTKKKKNLLFFWQKNNSKFKNDDDDHFKLIIYCLIILLLLFILKWLSNNKTPLTFIIYFLRLLFIWNWKASVFWNALYLFIYLFIYFLSNLIRRKQIILISKLNFFHIVVLCHWNYY